MIRQLQAVVWKEWKELLVGDEAGPWRAWAKILPLLALFVFWVSRFGDLLFGSPRFLTVAPLVAFFFVGARACDAFAGERERHTLETLLATPLSRPSIFLGKVAALAAHGTLLGALVISAMTATGLITGQITWAFLLSPLPWGSLSLAALMSVLVACLGVCISGKTATVRQAQTWFSLSWLALVIVVAHLLRVLPEILLEKVPQWPLAGVITGLCALLLVLDLAFLTAAMGQFRTWSMEGGHGLKRLPSPGE